MESKDPLDQIIKNARKLGRLSKWARATRRSTLCDEEAVIRENLYWTIRRDQEALLEQLKDS